MHTTSTESPPADLRREALEPDQLARSVQRSFSRSCHNQFSTSPLRAGILGLLTLGLIPLLRLRVQFRRYIQFERQQLWYFAELLRSRGHSEEASKIAGATRSLRYDPGLHWLQNLCVLAILAVFVFYGHASHHRLDQVLDRTFRFIYLGKHSDSFLFPFLAWNAGLAGAYTLHWLQVRRHRRAVAQLITASPPPRTDPDMKWPAVGLILAGLGGVWALAMGLAGAAQRRYINVTAAATRGHMLQRVRQLQTQPQPVPPSANYILHPRRCDNGLCRAALPPGAGFCPRCGSRA